MSPVTTNVSSDPLVVKRTVVSRVLGKQLRNKSANSLSRMREQIYSILLSITSLVKDLFDRGVYVLFAKKMEAFHAKI